MAARVLPGVLETISWVCSGLERKREGVIVGDERQYDRGSPDLDDYVPTEWLADWWSSLTFDAALDRYSKADDEHLPGFIAEEQFSDAGGLRLVVSWEDESGPHEEELLEIRPLR